MNILLMYIAFQLWTNSVGLTALYSLKPTINKRISDKGYYLSKNTKNIKDALMLFVPFYFLSKGLSLAYSESNIDKYVDDLIKCHKLRSKNIVNDDNADVDNVYKIYKKEFSESELNYTYKAQNREVFKSHREKEINPFVEETPKKVVSINDLVDYVNDLPVEQIEEIQSSLDEFKLAKKKIA
ncbi:MAG: hypothetical protein RR228_00080 [Bacilli bacterium]